MELEEAIKAIRPQDGLSIEGKALRVAQFLEGLAVVTKAAAEHSNPGMQRFSVLEYVEYRARGCRK